MTDLTQAIATTPEVRECEGALDAPEVPVIIIGGGACGLTAGLALHRLGVEAVVLERDSRPSGSTALSSGFVPAAATAAQRRQGIVDTPAQFAADIQAKAKGQAAAHLVQAYSEAIGPAMDALAEHHGLVWQVLDDFLYPGHSVHRMHAVPEKTGEGLMQRLQVAADSAGLPLMTDARVTELWRDRQGRLRGVGVLRPDGSAERMACRALLLACNGYGGSPDWVRQWIPEMASATYAGHVGNDGSAVQWGTALGAALADMRAYQGHGSWAVPQGTLISWAVMMQGGIQLNTHGARFHDETQGYSEAAMQVLAQPEGLAFNVFDDAILDFAQGFPDFVQAQAAGAVRTLPDARALAALLGCDEAAVRATLAGVTPGTCPHTGRVFTRSLTWPLHAIRVTGALFHTQGGLAIDAQARVLDPAGRPLPNLWAAGGAARGVSGSAVWGYLSGNGLLSAIAGGHIAAHAMAQHLAG